MFRQVNFMQQVTIYRNPERYAGWPANYGMWNWGNEIVLVFIAGYNGIAEGLHSRDKSRPFETMQARSLDGGQTWAVEPFPGKTPDNRGLSADEHMNEGLRLGEILDDYPSLEPTGNINFTHPDFAMMSARTGLKAGTRSFFYVSYDRCRTWEGRYDLPMFGQTAVANRTDYVVENENQCLMMLTVNKPDGDEGRILAVRTVDGGKTFSEVSYVVEDINEVDGFMIMPSTLKLENQSLLSAVRCRGGSSTWVDLYRSDDGAKSWQYMNCPVEFSEVGHNGNPPTVHQLPDGRLVLIYGNRDKPYTIGARLSDDNGVSWSDEITLREGGGNRDIGYPRTVVLPDGTVVTAYYFNEHADGERYIEATIWKP
jgi:hypothetical protein